MASITTKVGSLFSVVASTLSTIGWALLLAAAIGARQALSWKHGIGPRGCRIYSHIEYSTVTGFFLQDEPSTQAVDYDYAPDNFGLLVRSYPTDHDQPGGQAASVQTQWQRFERYINWLNDEATDDDTAYKVLFLARHGQGTHNVAESYYGTPAWDCYWAQQDGNGTVTWSDAELTAVGVAQARRAASFWASQVAHEGMPAPGSYYSSPLTRCLQTALATFGSLADPPPRVIVKEFLREGLSTHTCDRRSSRSALDRRFPGALDFEPGFADPDHLWSATTNEPRSAEVARSKLVLDEIFTEDDQTWVSITTHYGTISTMFEALGHRPLMLNPGQAIPVFVKAHKVYHAYPAPVAAWTTPVLCREPPMTSLPGRGCICSDQTSPTPTVRLPSTDQLSDVGERIGLYALGW